MLIFYDPVSGRVCNDPEVHADEVHGSLLSNCRFIWVEVKKAWLVHGSRATSPPLPPRKIFRIFPLRVEKADPRTRGNVTAFVAGYLKQAVHRVCDVRLIT